ncbi:MAG: hypothetical protein EP344_08710 [Bacteroidetes bacterium]|nr:MAG: hypothetical protein EP344_08710 [Bacteroidota bacterium]
MKKTNVVLRSIPLLGAVFTLHILQPADLQAQSADRLRTATVTKTAKEQTDRQYAAKTYQRTSKKPQPGERPAPVQSKKSGKTPVQTYSKKPGPTRATQRNPGNAEYRYDNRHGNEKPKGNYGQEGSKKHQPGPGRQHTPDYQNSGNKGHGHYSGNEHRHKPNWQYSKLPRRGTGYKDRPKHTVQVYHGGHAYYYNSGVYYHYDHNRYVVVRPPIGIRIRTLPAHCRTFYRAGRPYYYYYGTYYTYRSGYYEVIAPPVGSLVESIPDGYETLYIDGDTYYIVDGVQYKAVLYRGEIWYEVIKVF